MQEQHNLSENDKQLVKLACNHIKSRFDQDIISIGAALRTKSGKIYTGINLKYHVSNICICAESLAIYNALDRGENELDTVVGVKYFPETNSFEVVNGCGKCRQLYCQNAPLKVILDNKGVLQSMNAEETLPLAFI